MFILVKTSQKNYLNEIYLQYIMMKCIKPLHWIKKYIELIKLRKLIKDMKNISENFMFFLAYVTRSIEINLLYFADTIK